MRNRILSVFGFLCVAMGLILLIAGQNRLLVWLFVLLGACLSFFPLRLVVKSGELKDALTSLQNKMHDLAARLRRKSGRAPGRRSAGDAADVPQKGPYDDYLNSLLKELQREQAGAADSVQEPGPEPQAEQSTAKKTAPAADAQAESAAASSTAKKTVSSTAQAESAASSTAKESASSTAQTESQADPYASAEETPPQTDRASGPGDFRSFRKKGGRPPHFNENFFKQDRFRYDAAIPAQTETAPPILFFKGVSSEEDLKKRYRDLLKIYHPDNHTGDGELTLSIQREYEYLLSQFYHNSCADKLD